MRRSTFSRAAATIIVAIGLLSAVLVSGAEPVAAGTVEDEQHFISLVNQYRVANGLAPLAVHGELTSASLDWTQIMADRDTLAHAPDISAGVTAPWRALGENVGFNTVHDVQQLFDAFVASPGHRDNILGSAYTHIGVGVVYDEAGTMWTTHRFMALPTFESVDADPKHTEMHADVFRLYEAALGRVPDGEGALYWAAQRSNCYPLTEIAYHFVAGQEFTNRYGSLSDADYIARIYHNVLNRPPDDEGFAYWSVELASDRLDRAGLLLNFSLGEEFVTTHPLQSDARPDRSCG